jgi:hypothetical protein
MPADDHDDLSVVRASQQQRRQLLASDAELVVWHEPARADNAESRFGLIDRLQPSERRVVRIGQHHPTAVGSKPDQSLVERKNVRRLNGKRSKS